MTPVQRLIIAGGTALLGGLFASKVYVDTKEKFDKRFSSISTDSDTKTSNENGDNKERD